MFECCGNHRDLHSFPTRRSSDLAQHNVETALERWVEKAIAPNAIVATKYQGRGASTGVKMTRPLCPYPQIAKYRDRKSTRLNSSHANISYAVFCLKKKKHKNNKA